MVFNKCDRLTDDQASALRVEFPDSRVVSAITGEGLESLRAEIFTRSAEKAAQRRAAPTALPEEPETEWRP